MSNRKIIFIAVLIIIVGTVAFVFFNDSSDDSSTMQDANRQTTTPSTQQTNQDELQPIDVGDSVELTLVEVEKRNTSAECWTVIEGNVYDITQYLPRHPGGSEILRACGADSTSLFTSRQTDDGERVGSGSPHSSGAERQLQSFLLGPLQ